MIERPTLNQPAMHAGGRRCDTKMFGVGTPAAPEVLGVAGRGRVPLSPPAVFHLRPPVCTTALFLPEVISFNKTLIGRSLRGRSRAAGRRAFAQYELLFVLASLAVIAGIIYVLMPSLSTGDRRTPHQMMNSANVRGIEQAMALFAESNNNFLPGLDAHGQLLPASASTTGSNSATGAAFSSRLWVLLNGQYVGGDLLINPRDALTRWTSGRPCTTANFSYAGLQLGDDASATTTEHHAGRAGEWRINANSKAILFGDRLLVASEVADAAVQSVWTTTKGDWKGNIVWGDNHAQFCQTHSGYETQYLPYLATTAPATQPVKLNTNDNLFATQSAPGVTETSVNSDANAMLIYY